MSDAVIAQKGPYAIAIEAGRKYAWCACGKSAKQPFCDGAHKGSAFSPVVFEATESKTAYFCGCKASDTQPFCDGTHSRL